MFRARTQFHITHLKTTHRITAWLLLLVCAWIGSGGVLHHTEAEFASNPVPKSAASLHRQTAAAPVDTCAACEWMQGLQGRTLSICRVHLPLSYLPSRPSSATVLLLNRRTCHRPARAPPASSSVC